MEVSLEPEDAEDLVCLIRAKRGANSFDELVLSLDVGDGASWVWGPTCAGTQVEKAPPCGMTSMT